MNELPDPCVDAVEGGFEAQPVSVPPERILRMHGYREPARVRRPIGRAARTAADLAGPLIRGEGWWRRVAVHALEGDRLTLEDGACFRCEAFPKYLTGCAEVIAVVLTIGEAFDREVDRLMADNPVEGLFLDSAGWLGVEAVTRQFVDRLRALAAQRSLRPTRRLGPGYTYRVAGRRIMWNLEAQQPLFDLLGRDRLSVELLESSVMLPRMSRSGIFGLRPNDG